MSIIMNHISRIKNEIIFNSFKQNDGPGGSVGEFHPYIGRSWILQKTQTSTMIEFRNLSKSDIGEYKFELVGIEGAIDNTSLVVYDGLLNDAYSFRPRL